MNLKLQVKALYRTFLWYRINIDQPQSASVHQLLHCAGIKWYRKTVKVLIHNKNKNLQSRTAAQYLHYKT